MMLVLQLCWCFETIYYLYYDHEDILNLFFFILIKRCTHFTSVRLKSSCLKFLSVKMCRNGVKSVSYFEKLH